jgi:antitoxin component of MazEF toxin-antitoxin module
MRVGKRGSNLAVRIPATVVRALNLAAGGEVELRVVDGGSIELAKKKKQKKSPVGPSNNQRSSE